MMCSNETEYTLVHHMHVKYGWHSRSAGRSDNFNFFEWLRYNFARIALIISIKVLLFMYFVVFILLLYFLYF